MRSDAPAARSSCNNQADTPANDRPTAETGFIATEQEYLGAISPQIEKGTGEQ